MKLWDRLASALSLTTGKRLAGRDLQGNKYYEIASPPGGGRAKRSVKYNKLDHLSDYTSGKGRLPIQWAAWLSHTRPKPPTIDELQSDALRQDRLNPIIAAIQERERVERIRQGYGGDEARLGLHSHSPEYEKLYGIGGTAGGGSGPSTARVESTRLSARPTGRIGTGSTGSSGESRADQQSISPRHGESFEQRSDLSHTHTSYPVPTPPSPGVPPPTALDPSRHSSKEDLRRLSEEDTKRRMTETGVPAHPGAEAPKTESAGLKPRRRGALNSS